MNWRPTPGQLDEARASVPFAWGDSPLGVGGGTPDGHNPWQCAECERLRAWSLGLAPFPEPPAKQPSKGSTSFAGGNR